MKILLLSPVHRVEKGGKTTLGIPFYQGQASWVRALKKIGHEVQVFNYSKSVILPNSLVIFLQSFLESHFPIVYTKIRRVFQKLYIVNLDNYLRSFKLKKTIAENRPDVIIISGGISTILPFSLKTSYHPKIFLFSGVNPVYASTKLEEKLIKHGIIDVVVENDIGYAQSWEKIGAKKTIVLPISAVDSEIHKKKELTVKEKKILGSDVCFVGSITQDRVEKLKAYTRYNFKFWGDVKPGVSIPEELKEFYKGPAFGEKMIKIFNASKIVLNFQPKDMKYGGNMRTFEIPGCGAFQVVDRVDLSWFGKGPKLSTFLSVQGKMRYYIEQNKQRETLAKKWYDYVHKNHTYEKHFKKLFSKD